MLLFNLDGLTSSNTSDINFNTSNVTIQHIESATCFDMYMISIRLMLLFNKEYVHNCKGHNNFNTSNVTIQQFRH